MELSSWRKIGIPMPNVSTPLNSDLNSPMEEQRSISLRVASKYGSDPRSFMVTRRPPITCKCGSISEWTGITWSIYKEKIPSQTYLGRYRPIFPYTKCLEPMKSLFSSFIGVYRLANKWKQRLTFCIKFYKWRAMSEDFVSPCQSLLDTCSESPGKRSCREWTSSDL